MTAYFLDLYKVFKRNEVVPMNTQEIDKNFVGSNLNKGDFFIYKIMDFLKSETHENHQTVKEMIDIRARKPELESEMIIEEKEVRVIPQKNIDVDDMDKDSDKGDDAFDSKDNLLGI
jgi:hypothetical protein